MPPSVGQVGGGPMPGGTLLLSSSFPPPPIRLHVKLMTWRDVRDLQ
jgi:hypothetical protein